MDKDSFLRLLKAKVKEIGTQKAAAQAWSISEAFLSDVLHGNRNPGDKLLALMGFECIMDFRRIRK